jgi:lipoprotein-anchoring transpeptidase ErfK/SrfK
MARGRHEVRAARTRWPLIVGLASGLVVLALGGAAYAAYRYEKGRADLLLPGTTIAGVDVSGLTAEEATDAVWNRVRTELDRELTVFVGGKRFTVTAQELGRRAFVRDAIDDAMARADAIGWLQRAWHRLRDDPFELEIDVSMAGDGGIGRFVNRTARKVYRAPTEASIGIGDGGGLSFRHAKAGSALDQRRAERLLTEALHDETSIVRLSTHRVAPKVTAGTLGPTIVVNVATNRLDLYQGFDVARSWNVATAKPGWVTPVGEWMLYQKRENPTWYNPALDTWGAGLPAVVPGGPGNPMGTRALYITAPGLIRIHGTTSPESIGRYASHGCIRMHNEDVEELYELVPVGSKVIIVGQRPSWADEWDVPDTPDGSDTVA